MAKYKLLGKSEVRKESTWSTHGTKALALKALKRKRKVYGGTKLNYKFRIKKVK